MIAAIDQTTSTVRGPRKIDLGFDEVPVLDIRAIPDGVVQPVEPEGFLVGWLKNQVAVTTRRIDQAQRAEQALRERASLQAKLAWDGDRRLDAEILGSKLDSDPAGVVAALKSTPQGCEWLASRWAMLIHLAGTAHKWTFDQARLASRMLGLPTEFDDDDNPLELIDLDGRPLRTDGDLAELGKREIEQLLAHREQVAPLDENSRRLAEKSELFDEKWRKELKTLGCHERALYRHLRWLVREIDEREGPPPTVARPETSTSTAYVRGQMVSPIPEARHDVQELPGNVPNLPESTPRPESRRDVRVSKTGRRRE